MEFGERRAPCDDAGGEAVFVGEGEAFDGRAVVGFGKWFAFHIGVSGCGEDGGKDEWTEHRAELPGFLAGDNGITVGELQPRALVNRCQR